MSHTITNERPLVVDGVANDTIIQNTAPSPTLPPGSQPNSDHDNSTTTATTNGIENHKHFRVCYSEWRGSQGESEKVLSAVLNIHNTHTYDGCLVLWLDTCT